jgi:arabinose-5-phosphate isomerase
MTKASTTAGTERPARPEKRSPGNMLHKKDRLAAAADVLRLEARTIEGLIEHLGAGFDEAVERILACEGTVILTGLGKAGLVGAKISATMASTGTPSIALHPTEAMHGDLGRIRPDDVVVVLSNSGETAEIKALVPHIRRIGASIIAMTAAPDSSLGAFADCVLELGQVDEACPMGLAPTASTSAMMALGDALSMVVLGERDFSREDYARYHPKGSLGRRLMKVSQIMRTGKALPLVRMGATVLEVILANKKTERRPGAALVLDDAGRLSGIFTDGDLRRLLEQGDPARLKNPVDDYMGRNPITVTADLLVEDAERLLRQHKIDQLAVVDAAGSVVGLIDVQDLLDTHLA